MLRVVKPEGFGNIQVEEAPIPDIGPRQILVRTKATLISRGSELFRRYNQEEAIDPEIMGYSLAGVVERLGDEVTEYALGDRVMVVAPHAEYAVGDVGTDDARRMIVPIPNEAPFDEATFIPLATSAVLWAETSGAGPGDTAVILGQGLVGSLVMQALQARRPDRIIAVDATNLRCDFARRFGADTVINAAEDDPVEAIHKLTDGQGADVVIDCVGGNAGIRSFEQAQQMVRRGGTLHLVALYQGGPLPLDSSRIMNKRLLAGILTDEPRSEAARRAARMIADGAIRAREMITHRFPGRRAKEAFDLLWERPGEALGVVLTWE